MQLKMFVIYDSKANAYMQPWFLTTEQLAVRAFSDLANDPESNLNRHPDDYTLFTIGTFNDQTAKINWVEPKTLGNALEYKSTQIKTNDNTNYEELYNNLAAQNQTHDDNQAIDGEDK